MDKGEGEREPNNLVIKKQCEEYLRYIYIYISDHLFFLKRRFFFFFYFEFLSNQTFLDFVFREVELPLCMSPHSLLAALAASPPPGPASPSCPLARSPASSTRSVFSGPASTPATAATAA